MRKRNRKENIIFITKNNLSFFETQNNEKKKTLFRLIITNCQTNQQLKINNEKAKKQNIIT